MSLLLTVAIFFCPNVLPFCFLRFWAFFLFFRQNLLSSLSCLLFCRRCSQLKTLCARFWSPRSERHDHPNFWGNESQKNCQHSDTIFIFLSANVQGDTSCLLAGPVFFLSAVRIDLISVLIGRHLNPTNSHPHGTTQLLHLLLFLHLPVLPGSGILRLIDCSSLFRLSSGWRWWPWWWWRWWRWLWLKSLVLSNLYPLPRSSRTKNVNLDSIENIDIFNRSMISFLQPSTVLTLHLFSRPFFSIRFLLHPPSAFTFVFSIITPYLPACLSVQRAASFSSFPTFIVCFRNSTLIYSGCRKLFCFLFVVTGRRGRNFQSWSPFASLFTWFVTFIFVSFIWFIRSFIHSSSSAVDVVVVAAASCSLKADGCVI